MPAPFATIEREIEGRTRHFASWQWNERLVWRDLDYSNLWWATLDFAATLDDWQRAIESCLFGRAFTNECKEACIGERIGLPSERTFRLNRDFYVIAAKEWPEKKWVISG